ncbi:MAG: hydrogenase [Betaproteobacteria bacterium]|nr:hydrogenase [Betaproteobacteria bacterium]
MTTVAATPLHPLLARLFAEFGYTELTPENFEAFAVQPGNTLLFFAADPVRVGETPDVAVILPELARAFSGRFRVGVLLPAAASELQSRYGFRRWPALVLLRGGGYVGAIEGLRDWQAYVDELATLLEAPTRRAPSIGIAVQSAGAAHSDCH